jgi:hypothetical protein
MMNIMHSTTTHPQHMDDHLEPCQPAQLPAGITKDSPTDGELIGIPPEIFDGDRSNTDTFITEFYLFRIINDGNTVMTNPMRRVALALSYIRGPKVDAWVTQQCDALSIKINDARTHANTDEALWEDFIAEFKRAFAEPKWKVLARLDNLRMAGDEIEIYIAKFENLVRRAECNRESRSMVDKFFRGLPADFLRSITNRVIPDTIDEWQSAARNEVKKGALRKLYNLTEPDGDTDVSDAVQTGVIRLSRLSEEERARLMSEGRCFECNEKGHRARDCPDKLE